MSRIIILSASMALAAALTRPASAADSCGGGCPTLPKSFRAVSAELVALATFPGNTLTVTLAKGKTKRVLVADAMMTDNGSNGSFPVSREYDLGISVNGLAMNPSLSFGPGSRDATEDCGELRSDPDRKCTVVGHWWLDMDDPANVALLGVPITVTLVGGEPFGSSAVGVPVDMSLRVELKKK